MSDRWFKCPKCGAETREKFDAIDWYGGMANRREQYLGRSTKDGHVARLSNRHELYPNKV